MVAIDADEDSELVVSTASVNVILEEELEDEPTLSDELNAKVEAGNASKRLERRMKRKNDREAKRDLLRICQRHYLNCQHPENWLFLKIHHKK